MARPEPSGPLTAMERDLLLSVPERIERLRTELGRRIIGQEDTLRQLLLSFLAGGHVLVVGVPGLAKTLMIRSLAELFDLRFARVQFTPDLMPSDITGTSIIVRNEATGQREFRFRPGPIFNHLVEAASRIAAPVRSCSLADKFLVAKSPRCLASRVRNGEAAAPTSAPVGPPNTAPRPAPPTLPTISPARFLPESPRETSSLYQFLS